MALAVVDDDVVHCLAARRTTCRPTLADSGRRRASPCFAPLGVCPLVCPFDPTLSVFLVAPPRQIARAIKDLPTLRRTFGMVQSGC